MRKLMTKLSCAALASVFILSGCSTTTTENSVSKSKDPVTITFCNLSYGDKVKDLDLIQNKLNEYTLKKINVKLDFKDIDASNYTQQISTMLAGGEHVDLISSWGNMAQLVSQKQIKPLDDYLGKYGKDITNALGNIIDGGKLDGKTYSIPANSCKAYVAAFHFNKELVDKYNINLASIKNYKDLDSVLDLIKKNEPDYEPFALGDNIWSSYTFSGCMEQCDLLGDGYGYLKNYDDLTVSDLYESSEYKDLLTTMRSWYNKGYFNKDSATIQERGYDRYVKGKVFCMTNNDTLSQYNEPYENIGYRTLIPTYSMSLAEPIITNTVGFYNVAVPVTSEHPEEAITWLNLIYSDATAAHLLYHGIEGTHYKLNDDGTLTQLEGASEKWSTDLTWSFGNFLLQYPGKGSEKDGMKNLIDKNKSCKYSKAFGFNFDSSKVKNAYAACTNVVNQYRRPLECGSVDPETKLPEFISKLKAAGMDDVVKEKQTQLTAWYEKTKK